VSRLETLCGNLELGDAETLTADRVRDAPARYEAVLRPIARRLWFTAAESIDLPDCSGR
jgi:hypothetical protein